MRHKNGFRGSQSNVLGGPKLKDGGHGGPKAREVSSIHRVQLLAIISCGLMVVPTFLGEYPRDILSLFTYKKGNRESDNLHVQGQVRSSNSPLRPQRLRCPVHPIKLD